MKYFILILILLSASITRNATVQFYTVVWNVGQGQFISSITPSSCMHFDMGGEFFPWKKLFSHCKDKPNLAFLSHWDWDHVGALGKLKRTANSPLKELCIALRPLGTATEAKMKLLASFPSCESSLKKLPLHIWQPQTGGDPNSRSQVLLSKDVLVPGDSPVHQEALWLHQPWVKQSRILILGHHGSQTSTSQELLKSLRNLKMAVSSARWRRYHHPHPVVEARLSKARVPLLRTEDWGNIWIEEKMNY